MERKPEIGELKEYQQGDCPQKIQRVGIELNDEQLTYPLENGDNGMTKLKPSLESRIAEMFGTDMDLWPMATAHNKEIGA